LTPRLQSLSHVVEQTSHIIIHALGETSDEELKVELKGTFVSLGLDESNDTIDDKQLEIHVRYYNQGKREVVTDFLERKYTAHQNAKEITDHIIKLSTNLEVSSSK